MTYNTCHLNSCNSGIEWLHLAEITQEIYILCYTSEKKNEHGHTCVLYKIAKKYVMRLAYDVA